MILKKRAQRENIFFRSCARAREKSLIVVSCRQKGRRPQCYTRAGRARARARAKYPGHFRPAKKRPHQWIFEFFLRDWLELDEILPIIATKTKNSKKICEKKFVSKSPFQGLEPLPQILNKLGRNKKLNPSLANRGMGRCQTLKKWSNFEVLKAVKPHLACNGLRFF